jgi:hypothetical protein
MASFELYRRQVTGCVVAPTDVAFCEGQLIISDRRRGGADLKRNSLRKSGAVNPLWRGK